MSKYNLERLGWFNFERLATTLLRQVIGPGVSSFSGSSDQGRDATFRGKACFPSGDSPLEGRWIFQVKYRDYHGRSIAQVRDELKRTLADELHKILRKHSHRCDVYVLLTNCPLTAENKDDLEGAISSNDRIGSGFVLGEQDIEELLDVHAKVVRAFPQIMGIGQLRELVTWGINQRSIEYLSQVQDDLDTFVVTKPYLDAMELLHKKHFCIITGAPKMGKSCTADALAAAFSSDGYCVYELRTQKELYDVLDKQEAQLFICDDVFGDRKDEWTRSVAKLLRSLDQRHKLIWTARSYILTEAVESSKLIEDRPEIKDDTIVINVENLGRIEKAMILYNHAKKANLPDPIKDIIRAQCRDIVESDYFAPESIRQLCTGKIVELAESAPNSETVVQRVFEFLQSPGIAWKKAFVNSPSAAQFVCVQVMAEGGRILYETLRSKYDSEVKTRGHRWMSFEEAFAYTEGSFIKRRQQFDKVYVSFYHPSMRDLLVELIRSDAGIRGAYISRLNMSELTSLLTSVKNEDKAALDAHQVRLVEAEDVASLLAHVRENVLPSLTLQDATILLSALDDAARKHGYERLSDVGKIALRDIVQCASARCFWEANCGREDYSRLQKWHVFFQKYEQAIAVADVDLVPEYMGEALTELDSDDVVYWQLVETCRCLSEVVTFKHVDITARSICRAKLADEVLTAISSCPGDLNDDYEACNAWHDEYESLLLECESYVELFPDEEIEDASQLEQLFEEYPRWEPERDYEPDYGGYEAAPTSDPDISEIFADL